MEGAEDCPPRTALWCAVESSARSPTASSGGGSPMGAYYFGLDVHSRESVFVIRGERGVIVARGWIPQHVRGSLACATHTTRRRGRRSR